MHRLSVIIPTLQKDVCVLEKLLNQLLKEEVVCEVILIDNSRKGFEMSHPKLRVILPDENVNLYVNQSWNLGVKEAKEEWFALFNDDLLVCANFCKKVLDLISQTPDLGALGMAESSVIDTEIKTYPEISDFRLKLDMDERMYGWGTVIFVNKKYYKDIPEDIKIFCGDDYIRYVAKQCDKKVYALENAVIYHLGSLSSANPALSEIKKNDILFYGDIDVEFKKTTIYKKVNESRTFVGFFKKIIRTIFSLSNEHIRGTKYRVITLLGLRVRIKYN